jgi:hypothetical protein
MPIEKAWVKFYEWTEQYGGIAYIEALGNTMLILGNEEAVLDLLDRRAVNFSNRVRLNMLIDLYVLSSLSTLSMMVLIIMPMLEWALTGPSPSSPTARNGARTVDFCITTFTATLLPPTRELSSILLGHS